METRTIRVRDTIQLHSTTSSVVITVWLSMVIVLLYVLTVIRVRLRP